MSETDSRDYSNGRSTSQAFIDWCSSQPGSRVAAYEREALGDMLTDLFGYQLVQVGELGSDAQHLDCCPVRFKTLISHRAVPAAQDVIVAEPAQLPIDADSIDAMVLVHTLDFSRDPHQVLREVERVLIPAGRLIVIGFNPFSLWGLWRLFGRRQGAVPWCGHFVSYPRLNDWLSLLGFGIEGVDVMEFRPPTCGGQMDTFERLGRRFWPMLAGVYMVRAVKRVSRITPIRPRWSGLRALGSRAIEPSVRGVSDV